MTKKRTRLITDVAAVVEAFGGNFATARLTRLQPTAISMWIDRQYIPPSWQPFITAQLSARGLRAAPSVFGVTEDGRPLRGRCVGGTERFA
jgi:hypothetical protein